MTGKRRYKVNEMFYSLQGEGRHTGRPAVFVRFSGCNLACPWCDTKGHEKGEFFTREELESEVEELSHGDRKNVIVVLTGGEPSLQLSSEEELFSGYFRCIETNGTRPIPAWVDWKTVSPKDGFIPEYLPDELKIVFEPGRDDWYEKLRRFPCVKYLQPMERNGQMNLAETISYILSHPWYFLSLQTHKMTGVR